MDQDAAYALLGAGVIVGGYGISKAALDELLDPKRREKYAAEKAEKAKRIPLTGVDKAVQFVVMSITIGGAMMKVYDWYKTGKAPDIKDAL